MSSTDVFFGIGHFLQWSFGLISKPQWGIPIAITVVLVFGMLYWLYWEKRYTRRAKERNEFI
ncbi:MAG: hypothetical protein J5I62_05210 [Flavobacteriales bacterium]|nr:hypothetical protein [Flavobacteriales bacterium]MEB2341500.1 hypothetical protein [Flavobacteriia bacterium]